MILPQPKQEPYGPPSPYSLDTLHRLPLAEGFYRMWAYVAPGDLLATLFDQHRGRAYECCLTFSGLVDLVFKALLVHEGSGRTSFAAARESGGLDVTDQAAYGKSEENVMF